MQKAELFAKSNIYSARALRLILSDETTLGVFDHKGTFITMLDLADFDAGMRELWEHLWKASGRPPYEVVEEAPKVDFSDLFGGEL